jgi:hypothetical protein
MRERACIIEERKRGQEFSLILRFSSFTLFTKTSFPDTDFHKPFAGIPFREPKLQMANIGD